MQLAPEQCNLDANASPSFCAGRKLNEVEQALLWSILQEEPACPSRALFDKAAQRQIWIAVSLRQVNRWRARWGSIVRRAVRAKLKAIGVVALWHRSSRFERMWRLWGCMCLPIGLTNDAFGPVVARLTPAIENHQQTDPADDFALVHHREQTLRHRFEALFFAP
jgi:hypothetical protein